MHESRSIFDGLSVYPHVFIEQPPPASRMGTLAGDRRGQRTWMGIGRSMGQWETFAWIELGVEAQWIPQSRWTSTLAHVVRSKKDGVGGHRILEASHLVQGAREAIEAIDSKAAHVDAAEAILFGAAGCVVLPEWEF